MRLYADKLDSHLQHNLAPVYLLMGNEPLLRQESKDAIIKAAQAQQFLEKHTFTLDKMDWQLAYDACQAMSLFSARQIIDIEIGDAGVNASAGKELVQLASMRHDDILLIISASKFNRNQEKTAWFKALHQNGVLVTCNTPEIKYLPQFVQARCRALGLSADQESLQLLAQWHEGNLFALMQSLEKLTLLYPDGQLTVPRLESSLSRHHHFTVFHWIDALLEGKIKRGQRILHQLKAEEQEPIILVRSLQKELFLLYNMQQQVTQMPMNQVFDQYHIWQNKRPFYTQTLQRLTASHLQQLIHQLSLLEIMLKTTYDQDAWLALSSFAINFCQPEKAVNL